MTRVEINADGRSVAIDSATDMQDITERALAVWRETATPHKAGAGTAGFSSERSSEPRRPRIIPVSAK